MRGASPGETQIKYVPGAVSTLDGPRPQRTRSQHFIAISPLTSLPPALARAVARASGVSQGVTVMSDREWCASGICGVEWSD